MTLLKLVPLRSRLRGHQEGNYHHNQQQGARQKDYRHLSGHFPILQFLSIPESAIQNILLFWSGQPEDEREIIEIVNAFRVVPKRPRKVAVGETRDVLEKYTRDFRASDVPGFTCVAAPFCARCNKAGCAIELGLILAAKIVVL